MRGLNDYSPMYVVEHAPQYFICLLGISVILVVLFRKKWWYGLGFFAAGFYTANEIAEKMDSGNTLKEALSSGDFILMFLFIFLFFSITTGKSITYYLSQNKRMYICAQCENVQDKNTLMQCDECKGQLEPLQGFYDRHGRNEEPET